MKKKEVGKGYSKKVFKIMVICMTIMILIAVSTAIIFYYVMHKLNYIETGELTEYDAHYVFISDVEEQDFWSKVYDAACLEAEEDNVYVEYLKDSLGVNYSNADLFRVAINSGVDGIIYGGNADEKIENMINLAVGKGIVVVLLQNDLDASARQCFVGVNNYELGQKYAMQIKEIFGDEDYAGKKIDLLINANMSEGASNVLTIAMEDYFIEQNEGTARPEIEIVRIDSQDVFSVEEDIRNYMLSGDLPDVTICLGSTYTQCAYQALVDLNKVGETQIVGYFVNDTILDAISRNIIYSTLTVDTQTMGKSCIRAIQDYRNEGYTNSFIAVTTSVIGQDEARNLIDETESEE